MVGKIKKKAQVFLGLTGKTYRRPAGFVGPLEAQPLAPISSELPGAQQA